MQLRTALQQGLELLRNGRVDAPGLTAEVLLCHALRRERIYLYSHPEHELSEVEWLHYGRYLHERLQGKPTQYITRTQEFWGRDFRVEPGVLIPRPETEHVVEEALAMWGGSPEPRGVPSPRSETIRQGERIREASDDHRSVEDVDRGPTRASAAGQGACPTLASPSPRAVRNEGDGDSLTGAAPSRILDIGTGSGILAITLALETGAPASASDISATALDAARGNAARLGAACTFAQCDLGSAFANSRFDLVVSNPPYIESAALAGLQREVRDWEPHLALDGGASGLEIYARLIPEAARLLRPGGWLILEIGSNQGETVPALFGAGWQRPVVVDDLAGLPRVVKARRL